MNQQIIQTIAAAASAKKATDIAAFDLGSKSDICDLQVICSANSERQAQAIADEVELAMKKQLSMPPVAIEGRSSGTWIAMDFGKVICHIFLSSMRQYYALESLWPESKIEI